MVRETTSTRRQPGASSSGGGGGANRPPRQPQDAVEEQYYDSETVGVFFVLLSGPELRSLMRESQTITFFFHWGWGVNTKALNRYPKIDLIR